jgi:cytochrome P450
MLSLLMERGPPVRDDIAVLTMDQFDPSMRAMLFYEQNGVFDLEEPRPLFADMLESTPVVQWEFGVGFFGAKDIIAAARNPDIVSNDPQTGRSFGMGSRDPLIPLNIDGEKHEAYRKLLEPLLSAKALAGWEMAVRSLADELIDAFIEQGEVEFMEAFAAPLPGQIFLRLFGMPLEDLDLLVGFKDRILKSTIVDLEARDAEAVVAGDELRAHLRKRLDERKGKPPQDDLIGHFTTFEVDGERLSEDEVINIMHLFTIAGLDTVTASLSLIVAWLAQHPAEQTKLADDPSLLPTAIEELMRVLSPVAQGGQRFAIKDTDVNGVPVAKGSMVFLGWATANLDPEVFENPLDVDLTRRPNRHLAFAAGTHRCLGSHLARLELKAAIDQLHRRIKDYRIVDGRDAEYVLEGVRQCRSLPLAFTAVS